MAASDLQSELAKDGFQVEGDSEQRLVQAVLQQLEDPSGDISALGVKWCSPGPRLASFLVQYLAPTLLPTRPYLHPGRSLHHRQPWAHKEIARLAHRAA